jgi:hypothetical protein
VDALTCLRSGRTTTPREFGGPAPRGHGSSTLHGTRQAGQANTNALRSCNLLSTQNDLAEFAPPTHGYRHLNPPRGPQICQVAQLHAGKEISRHNNAGAAVITSIELPTHGQSAGARKSRIGLTLRNFATQRAIEPVAPAVA